MAETEVIEKTEVETPAAPANPEQAPDTDKENQWTPGAAPPKRGICRRCGQNKPINRLMLCYRCFVITNLEDEAKRRGESWHEGDPHPDGCKCVGLGEHKGGDGTAQGFN